MYLYNKEIKNSRKEGRSHVEGPDGLSLCGAEYKGITFDTHSKSKPKGRKFCVGCKKRHRTGKGPKRKPQKKEIPGSQVSEERLDNFYKSFQWRRARYEALDKNDGRCECCGRSKHEGIYLCVDHIKPLRYNWKLRIDPDNLQILCNECNHGKGAAHVRDWREPSLKKLMGEE